MNFINGISRRALRVVLSTVMMFVAAFFVRAQESSLRIYYKFDNATVYTDYLSNPASFAKLDEIVSSSSASNGFEIVTFSSPEGNFEYNARLAARRAESLRNWVYGKYPQLNGKVSIRPNAESWEDLRLKVESDSRLSSDVRSRVLPIIDSDMAADAKEAALKAMPEYNALYANYFRTLRFAEIRLAAASEITNPKATVSEVTNPKEIVTLEAEIVASSNAAQQHDYASARTSWADVIFALRSSTIDSCSFSNRAVLVAIASMLEGKSVDDVAAINIVSSASPEGPLAINDRLSIQRGQALRDYIVSSYPELSGKISVRSAGEAWDDLKPAVESDPSLSEASRSKILSIIVSDAEVDAKEAKLRALPEWKHLFEDIFPSLRYARINVSMNETPADITEIPSVADQGDIDVDDETVAVTDTTMHLTDTTVVIPVLPAVPAVEPADTAATAPADTAGFDTAVSSSTGTQAGTAEIRPWKTIAAVKTNLLYDAVTALNFEVEVPIGRRWSVMAEDIFPWWETGNKYCFQMWEIGLEGRYWLKPWDVNGTEKLRGLFGGIYAMSSKYDFQYDKSVNYQGEYWSAGITAGYSKPIGRKKRVNLEMSLSLGYLDSPYRHYMPTDDYSKLIRDPYNVGRVKYFGPTKAKISLVVPINVPRKKEVSHE